MSLDRSLKGANALVRHRNVLTRDERLAKLKEMEKWNEQKSVFGLPKVAHRKLVVGGKGGAKEEVAEGAAGAVAGAAATGAAPAATTGGAKAGTAPAKGAAAPAKGKTEAKPGAAAGAAAPPAKGKK
jgi:small basic protein (TIGR04137 family)